MLNKRRKLIIRSKPFGLFKKGRKKINNYRRFKKLFYLYPSKRPIHLRHFRPQRGRFSFRLFFNEKKHTPVFITKPLRNRFNYISRKSDARVAKLLGIKLIYRKKKVKKLKSILSKEKLVDKRNKIKPNYIKRVSYKRTIFKDGYFKRKERISNFALKHKLVRICLGHLIRKGRKAWAEKTLSEAFFLIKKKYLINPSLVLLKAIQTLRPTLGLRPKKKGGVIYRVPFLLKDTKQWSLAIFWLINSVRQKMMSSTGFSNKLYEEIVDVISGKIHSALKKKDEIHKLALTNRPFLK